jgi:hypothetical protein
VLTLAAGGLLAIAFQGLGWSEPLAKFVGIIAAGLVVSLVGLVFVLKGVRTLSKSSLKPERTLETLRDLRGNDHANISPKPLEPKALQPSKEELASRIGQTRSELKHTMHKARKRAAWGTAAGFLGRHARRHPLRMLIIGAGAGLARHAMRHRRAKHVEVS